MLKKIKSRLSHLKKEVSVLLIAYGDRRTPLLAKLLAGLTVAYLLSPVDLIPDFIPILGLLDDLILVPLLITLSLKMIPADVLQDARQMAKKTNPTNRPRSWLAPAVIVLLWLLILSYLVKLFISE